MRNKISKVQYFLVSCLFLFTSNSSELSYNKTCLILWCLFSTIYYLTNQVHAAQHLLRTASVLLCTTTFYYLINNKIDTQTHLGFFVYVLGAFSTVRVAGRELPEILVKIVYILALVSLPLYTFQIVSPSLLFELNDFCGLAHRGNSNSLIFNFTYIHINRNCGFMWEPGAFAGILIICLYINVTVLEPKKSITNRNVILFIALLTTLSTLGYITLAFPLIATIINRKQYKYLFLLILIIPLVFSLDFLLPKLFKESSNLNDELQRTQYATENSPVSVSRSASFAIDFTSFLKRPIVGYGLDFRTVNAEQIFKEYDENVIRSSGVMNLLLRFGLVGFFCYAYLIYRSYCFYSGKKLAILFSTLVLFVLFSNPIDNSPFLFCLFFFRPYDLRLVNKVQSFPKPMKMSIPRTKPGVYYS